MKSFDDYMAIFIHQSDLLIEEGIKKKLATFNLAPQQSLIIILLWKKDGINQNEIAEKLNKDKTNIARMISNLEKKGFIRREKGGEDWRSLSVYLTDEGKQLSQNLRPMIEDFNNKLCKGVSSEEILGFKKVFKKMRSNIQ